MKVLLHCIARIHGVYLKEVDPLASLMVLNTESVVNKYFI